jgi:hypothetical protein
MNPILRELQSTEVFQILLEELKANRPVIPGYDWQKDNTEEIKAKSLLAQGFDLAMALMQRK